jgi:hypothetical protein
MPSHSARLRGLLPFAFALALGSASGAGVIGCAEEPPAPSNGNNSGNTNTAGTSSAAARAATTGAPQSTRAAPGGPAADLRDRTLASSEALETVRSLTDEAGPRLSGSPGDALAVAWGLRALEKAGFSNVHAEKVTVPHWERGAESAAIVSPTPHALAIAALGGSVATPAGGLSAEVVEAESLEALDKLERTSVEGKIVFFNKKMDRTKDASGYGRAVDVRSRGAIHAAKLGAAGVVVRSVGTDHNRLPHTGGMRYEDRVTKIPAASISIPDAELLHRLVAAGKPVKLQMTLGARSLPDAESANIVGDVPGSAAPEEIVLLGAHLDSWDLGTGAVDDGAGCAIIIEAGRQIAKLPKKPRRTVRVVLFANEENGLGGARAYAKAHEAELARHVVATEADLGAGRVHTLRYLGAPEGRPAFVKIAENLIPFAVTISDEDAEGGADLIPLRPAGVPIVDLRQDATVYFDLHHTANDTFDKIEKAEIDEAAAAFAAVAFAAADMSGDFGRIPAEKREPKAH